MKPTKVQRYLSKEDVIVSKTDPKGVITYANRVFCRINGYEPKELIGAPHNIIRHPDMPRCIFKFLWDRINNGEEIFAYVKNMTREGDFYWVLAQVTPTYDTDRNLIGHHSFRRCPDRKVVQQMEVLYRKLRAIEQDHSPREGLELSLKALASHLQEQELTYDEFIFSHL